MKYYVYILKDGDVPIYVGKGTKRRMYKHKQEAVAKNRNTPLYNKIRKMLREERDVVYEVLFETDDAEEAFTKEIELISIIGRKDLQKGPLLNLTKGGEGVRGKVITEESRANLSVKIKLAIQEGRFDPGENLRQYKKIPEYIQLQAQRRREYYQTPEGEQTRQRLREIGKNKLVNGKRTDLTPEGRQRLSEARKRANLKRNTS